MYSFILQQGRTTSAPTPKNPTSNNFIAFQQSQWWTNEGFKLQRLARAHTPLGSGSLKNTPQSKHPPGLTKSDPDLAVGKSNLVFFVVVVSSPTSQGLQLFFPLQHPSPASRLSHKHSCSSPFHGSATPPPQPSRTWRRMKHGDPHPQPLPGPPPASRAVRNPRRHLEINTH